jgi:nucleoside 2-deoxyribosyltransferase
MSERRLTIYLAGPISNCGENQKKKWREDLRDALHRKLHPRPTIINPADTKWVPLQEIEEIDRCDVVIANMWRESIGTTVGIVHARRTGKPVILIDPNYLDSKILKELVGRRPVRSVDEAVKVLIEKVAPEVNQPLQVRKANGALEPFSLAKLHRSLDAFLEAGFDVWLPARIHAAVRQAASGSTIETSAIKAAVFRVLDEVTAERPLDRQRALARREAWNRYAGLKQHGRGTTASAGLADALQQLQSAKAGLEEKNAQIRDLELELQNTRDARNSYAQQLLATRPADARQTSAPPPPPTSLAQRIRERTGGRKILCISRIGHSSVRDALMRHGLEPNEFDSLFEERFLQREPNSNFNADLKKASKSYSFAIYAWKGLRHAASPVKKRFDHVFQGNNAEEAVTLFLGWVDGAKAAAMGSHG